MGQRWWQPLTAVCQWDFLDLPKIKKNLMWAEIHGKLTGNPLASEDMLTGNFFGLLQLVSPQSQIFSELIKEIKFEYDSMENTLSLLAASKFRELVTLIEAKGNVQPEFSFWEKNGRNEIDMMIRFENLPFLIGIEVKYNSNLSSNDSQNVNFADVDKSTKKAIEESRHQLLRYAREFSSSENEPKASFFVIWGRRLMTFEIVERLFNSASQSLEMKELASKNIYLGYMTWESALERLERINMNKLMTFADRKILENLIKLLKYKSFDSFKCFDLGNLRASILNLEEYFKFETNEDKWPDLKVSKTLFYEFL